MDVDEIQTWRRAPMAEQARLDVFALERLSQQGIREKINLANRQIIRRPPVGVHFLEQFGAQRTFLDFLHVEVVVKRLSV